VKKVVKKKSRNAGLPSRRTYSVFSIYGRNSNVRHNKRGRSGQVNEKFPLHGRRR